MSDDTISIEVDGKTLEAKRGQMLIEVTDANDIYIPRFCYHPKLSVAANCRMCLVEVEKAPKPLPACATPVNDGMVVKTQSGLAMDSQQSVMEFLLINHPLDCPICDQGGECELQDIAMGYGSDVSRYQESKRVVKDKDIGPLVKTEMTRCIHCTRCVRFGEEIAGLRELGATGRGEHMEIGTYIEKSMVSELSGNVIDVCPVGALTSKPFRFSARSWEMKQGKGIAPHDCVGSNLEIHTKGNTIKRVVPAENEAVNEVWISDRDRFSYEGLYAEERLLQPKIKQNNEWKTVTWDEALNFCVKGLEKVKRMHGAETISGLISPSATTEEMFLFQSLLRGFGSNNIEHRLQQQDFSNDSVMPAFPSLGCSISDLENMDAVLLINSDIRYQQPMLNHRIRKAALKGAKVMSLGSIDMDANYSLFEQLITGDDKLVEHLSAISHIVNDKTDNKDLFGLNEYLSNITLSEQHKTIAETLVNSKKVLVLIGSNAFSHSQFSIVTTLASSIANASNAKLGFLTQGANASGAWLAGAVSKNGLNTQNMIQEGLKSYVLFNVEPEQDIKNLTQALNDAEFSVAITGYDSESLKGSTNVLLPLALFAETDGSFINIEGRLQAFKQLVKPQAEIKQGWKILRELASRLNIDSIQFNSFDELHNSIAKTLGSIENHSNQMNEFDIRNVNTENSSPNYQRKVYSIDSLLRHAASLQQREAGT